jgi:hypothetical protein
MVSPKRTIRLLTVGLVPSRVDGVGAPEENLLGGEAGYSFSIPLRAANRSSAVLASRRSVAIAAVSGKATGIQRRAVKIRRLKSMLIREDC